MYECTADAAAAACVNGSSNLIINFNNLYPAGADWCAVVVVARHNKRCTRSCRHRVASIWYLRFLVCSFVVPLFILIYLFGVTKRDIVVNNILYSVRAEVTSDGICILSILSVNSLVE